PDEVFSFNACVGRADASSGYDRAAVLKGGRLTQDAGGAICLVSTLLYGAALLSGMDVVERRCHSVDSYGPERYFELGRDAAVNFPYIDLRLRNVFDCPLLLRTSAEETS